MEQNKIRTYLKYALGEIALVMIGILLALQINNWNEERKADAELNLYLQSIQSNIKGDQVVLDSLIIRRRQVVDDSKRAQLSFLNKEFDFSTTRFGLRAYVDFYFAPNTSGFEALKNSAYFGRINGTELSTLLVQYNALIEEISQQEKSYNEFVENLEVDMGSETDRSLMMAHIFMDPAELASTRTTEQEIIDVYKKIYESSGYRNIVSQAVQTEGIVSGYINLKDTGSKIINNINQHSND